MEEGSAGAQGDMGGLYVLRVLLNLGVWRNGQEKIKKVREILGNQPGALNLCEAAARW